TYNPAVNTVGGSGGLDGSGANPAANGSNGNISLLDDDDAASSKSKRSNTTKIASAESNANGLRPVAFVQHVLRTDEREIPASNRGARRSQSSGLGWLRCLCRQQRTAGLRDEFARRT